MRRFAPLLLTGCAWMLPRVDPGEVCGDGEWTGLEACDPLEPTYGPWCKDDCTWHVCGDGIVGVDEACDGTAGCSDNCTLASCGNGAVDPGELCLEAGSVVAVGEVADLTLGDPDADGDQDLLGATEDGLRVWFDDSGSFTRSGLAIAATGLGAVGAAGRTLAGASPDGLDVAYWNGASYTVEHHDYELQADVPARCTSVWPGTLSGGLGPSYTVLSWACAEGGFEARWLSHQRLDGAIATHFPGIGADSALSYDTTDGFASDTWFGKRSEPEVRSSYGDVVALPAAARALRPTTARGVGVDFVALTNDGFVVIGGTAVTAELPAAQAIDGTVGYWDEGTQGVYDLDAVYLVHEGLRVRLDDGTVLEGPAIDGLTRLLVADFDQDGFLDVAAYRPASGEVLVWMQRP